MGVSPDGKLVVATSEASSTAHFIDAATGQLLDSVIVGIRPRDVLFLDGGRKLWVSSEQRGTISVFDAATRRIVARIDLVPAFPDIEPVQAVEMRRDPRRQPRLRRHGARQPGRRDRSRDHAGGAQLPDRRAHLGHRPCRPTSSRLYAASGLSGDHDHHRSGRPTRWLARVKLGGQPWGVGRGAAMKRRSLIVSSPRHCLLRLSLAACSRQRDV